MQRIVATQDADVALAEAGPFVVELDELGAIEVRAADVGDGKVVATTEGGIATQPIAARALARVELRPFAGYHVDDPGSLAFLVGDPAAAFTVAMLDADEGRLVDAGLDLTLDGASAPRLGWDSWAAPDLAAGEHVVAVTAGTAAGREIVFTLVDAIDATGVAGHPDQPWPTAGGAGAVCFHAYAGDREVVVDWTFEVAGADEDDDPRATSCVRVASFTDGATITARAGGLVETVALR